MKWSFAGPCLAVLICAAHARAGGCQKDTDCKGDRICEKGKCVAPAASPSAKSDATSTCTTPVVSCPIPMP